MLLAEVSGPVSVSVSMGHGGREAFVVLWDTYQTMITTTIMVNMMEQMIMTKLSTSLSNVVNPVLGVLVSFAIRPKTVESPVDTTTPMLLPDMQ
jgi:hypothetical protein